MLAREFTPETQTTQLTHTSEVVQDLAPHLTTPPLTLVQLPLLGHTIPTVSYNQIPDPLYLANRM